MVKNQRRLSIQQYVIILLAIATALVHFTLILGDLVFTLNALGYLALVIALYAPLPFLAPYRNQIRWVLIGYTALTVILWVFIPGARTTIAYIDKLIEILLIILLWLESQKAT